MSQSSRLHFFFSFFTCVCLVVDNEFRHSIVNVVCRPTDVSLLDRSQTTPKCGANRKRGALVAGECVTDVVTNFNVF